MKTFLIFLVFLVASASFVFSQGQPALVVALKPDKNPDAMLEKQKELSTYLSKKMDRPVEVIVPLSGSTILEGLGNGSIDAAYVSAMDMVNALAVKAANLLVAEVINGSTSYESYWLVRQDAPYQCIEDLRGKPIAFASRTSTSGYLIPMLDLKRRGLLDTNDDPESFFGKGNVWFGTGYVSAITRVFAGEADAAAVSDYVFNTDKYLSPEERSKLRVLQCQGPVPTHVIAVSSKLSEPEQDKLRRAFLALNNDENRRIRESVFNAGFEDVNPEQQLEPIYEALKVIGR